MPHEIEPALTPERWAALRDGAEDVAHYYFIGEKAAAIAAINDELDDADPRKITREVAEEILMAAQMAADVAKWCDAGWLGALAKQQAGEYRQQEARLLRVYNAFASYLPPEP